MAHDVAASIILRRASHQVCHALAEIEQYSHARSSLVSRGYGATAARLTPDQKVGSSNLSGLI